MKFIVATLLLLSLACFIACEMKTATITMGADTTTIKCKNVKVNELMKEVQYVYTIQATGDYTNVDVTELWTCDNVAEFSDKAAYDCQNELPNSDKCQMIYRSDGANTLNMPNGVGMQFGAAGYKNLVLVVRPNTASTAPGAVGFTMTGNNTLPVNGEAGVMTLGLSASKIYVPSNTETTATSYSLSTSCENTCATATAWNIFAAQTAPSTNEASTILEFWDGGRFNGSAGYYSYPTTSAKALTTGVSLKNSIGVNDYFNIRCNYNVVADRKIGGDSVEATKGSCKAFLLYYPKGVGISSCVDTTCVNGSGLPDRKTNTIVNYIALVLTGIVIGFVVCIACVVVLNFIKSWFEKNRFRFSKKYIKSCQIFNPIWWTKSQEEIEPEDEEELNIGLKNENDGEEQQDDIVAADPQIAEEADAAADEAVDQEKVVEVTPNDYKAEDAQSTDDVPVVNV